MKTAGPRSGRLHDGHTLWEVLLVLALLGAIAGLVAPSIRFVRPAEDDAVRATRDLAAVLERARLTSLERGTTIDVRLDPAGGRAWIIAIEGDTLHLMTVASFDRVSRAEVSGGGPRPRYLFTPGRSASGPTLTIRGANGARTLSVDPWSGGTRVASR